MLSITKGRLFRCGAWLLGLAVAAVAAFPGFAGQERYDYDGLGRVVRVIDERNRVTEYVYDAVGNLMQVVAGSQTAQPLSIAGVSPSFFRRGETKAVIISGANLQHSSVAPSDPAIEISGVQTSGNQIVFTMMVPANAALGSLALHIASAAGSADVSINIAPSLPKIQVEPSPLAIPPDNVLRQFTLRLSNADAIDHTIGLAAGNGSIVVSPASVTIPAGQTSAKAGIKGVGTGQSSLLLTSPTLGNTAVPVFVTTEFVGISTSFATTLGVVRQAESNNGASTVITPVASRAFGVLVGSYLGGVAPNAITVGSGPLQLTVTGTGLETAQSISVVPDTGLTLGSLSVASDGKSLSVPVTVAASAPISMRRVIVKNGAGMAFPAASAEADRIQVVRQRPEIFSIDPLFGAPGSLANLTIRGRNLQDAQAVTISRPDGIALDVAPQVNADGTGLSVRMAIGPTAALGAHTVQVLTPAGTSSGEGGAENTFTVVNEIQGSVTPVVAPTLGVLVQENAVAPAGVLSAHSRQLGVAVGPVATGITPSVGIIGQSMTLTVEGRGLESVSAVQFVPSTGLTVGIPTVAADGKSLSVPISIDTAAPQTLRTIRLLAGQTAVPFASADGALLRIAAPPPQIDSITPNYLQTGQPAVSVIVRGKDLQGATAVRLEPTAGATVFNPPVVNGSGTELTVNISAAIGAALGPRALVVTTPGGDSTTSLSAFNTLALAANLGPIVTPVISPLLGIAVATSDPNNSTSIGPIASPLLGVNVERQELPAAPTSFVVGQLLGVSRGPVATGMEPSGFTPGASGTLVVRGYAFGNASSVTVNPAAGITLGVPSIAPDGSTILVPISIAANAAPVPREVVVTSNGVRVPFSNSAASTVAIGPGVPRFDSITPILATQGERVTMTIRGANLAGTIAVLATPADGIQISTTPSVNADGTVLTVDMQITPDAALGARVIQVLVPGAASSAEASPMNTFTVYGP